MNLFIILSLFTINLVFSILVCFHLHLLKDLSDIYLCLLAFIYGEELSLLYVFSFNNHHQEVEEEKWWWQLYYLGIFIPAGFFVLLLLDSINEIGRILKVVALNILAGCLFELLCFHHRHYLGWGHSENDAGSKID